MSASKRFVETRDRLLRLREDSAAARDEFTWPVFDEFNWASEYFDVIAHDNEKPALRPVEVAGHAKNHTGDVAQRDADGSLTYAGRMDDVIKSSDYRISPFELESVLIEHETVAEAAVVPSPDPLRPSVPKALSLS